MRHMIAQCLIDALQRKRSDIFPILNTFHARAILRHGGEARCVDLKGVPRTFSSGLGQLSVKGRMRSPRPAARIMACAPVI